VWSNATKTNSSDKDRNHHNNNNKKKKKNDPTSKRMDIFQFEHEDGTVTHGAMEEEEDDDDDGRSGGRRERGGILSSDDGGVFELEEDLYIEADIPLSDTEEEEGETEEINIAETDAVRNKKVTARDFEIISMIGKGAYGKVHH
jgi:hypothetical protein